MNTLPLHIDVKQLAKAVGCSTTHIYNQLRDPAIVKALKLTVIPVRAGGTAGRHLLVLAPHASLRALAQAFPHRRRQKTQPPQRSDAGLTARIGQLERQIETLLETLTTPTPNGE